MVEGLHKLRSNDLCEGKRDGHAEAWSTHTFPPTSLLFAYKSSGAARLKSSFFDRENMKHEDMKET